MSELSSRRIPWHPRRRKLCLAALLALAASGCEAGQVREALEGNLATSGTILALVSQVETDQDDPGTVTPGALPSGTTAGFELTVTPGSEAVTNGGTATVTLTAPSAFSEVNVGAEGVEGFYRVSLPAPTTSVDLRLTVDQDIAQPTLRFLFTAGDGTSYGPVAQQEFIIVFVGTGDIQVSLVFDRQDDLDLWVVDPNGDTVYYANRTVASGGTLDLDANPVCTAPFGNSENITWPEGTAVPGTYEVYVDLFQSCSGAPVNYNVTITVVGSPPEIVSGTFQAADAPLSPELVATFTVSTP